MTEPHDFRSHSDLVLSLAKTITNPENWDEALKRLCEYCGASKALITRRNVVGATIIIPQRVEESWQSPLIYGFSEEEVLSFLESYQFTDPWTKIEAQSHPYQPYALSKYLPLRKLMKTDLWPWLEPQNIHDCLTAEICFDKTGWTALNLYLDAEQAPVADKVVERLKSVLTELSEFWKTGRSVFLAGLDDRPIHSLVNEMDQPCLILGPADELLAANNKSLELQKKKLINLKVGQRVGMPLAWAENVTVGTELLSTNVAAADLNRWTPVAIKQNLEEHASGEQLDHHIIIFRETGLDDNDDLPWLHPSLTERERVLVRHLAEGGKVQDGAKLFDISIRANATIWKSASAKLGHIKKQDLRTQLKNAQNMKKREVES